MLIVISGGSTTAEFLISMMLEQNHRIVVIEEDRETIDHLAEVLPPQVLIVEGDGTDSAAQLDAGVDDADLFVALMGHDDVNLVACEIAMTAFNVPRCIANVNSPKNIRIFREVGIEPVSSTELIARMVDEEATLGDMHMVFALRQNDIVLAKTRMPARMHHKDGIRVGDVPFKDDARIIAVVQGEDSVMVDGDTVLLPNQLIIAAVQSGAEDEFKAAVKRL